MKLELLYGEFTVCKVRDMAQVDFSGAFCFVCRTDTELSVLCPSPSVPEGAFAREDGFRGFRFAGTLDFSLTGVISGITGVLAGEKVPVFAVSTFDTDYVFIKNADLPRAKKALAKAGYDIVERN